MITFDIIPGVADQPPTVRSSAYPYIGGDKAIQEAIMADTDEALVARAMLQAAAYLFAKGQPVQFGTEIPLEALK